MYLKDDILNTKQAASYAQVNPRTIITWIHIGRLAAGRAPSKRGAFKIKFSDLEACLQWRNEAEPAP